MDLEKYDIKMVKMYTKMITLKGAIEIYLKI